MRRSATTPTARMASRQTGAPAGRRGPAPGAAPAARRAGGRARPPGGGRRRRALRRVRPHHPAPRRDAPGRRPGGDEPGRLSDLRVTGRVYSGAVAAGDVLSQSPAPGKLVRAGAGVTVVVSEGHAPVKVPSVIGATRAAAIAALQHGPPQPDRGRRLQRDGARRLRRRRDPLVGQRELRQHGAAAGVEGPAPADDPRARRRRHLELGQRGPHRRTPRPRGGARLLERRGDRRRHLDRPRRRRGGDTGRDEGDRDGLRAGRAS